MTDMIPDLRIIEDLSGAHYVLKDPYNFFNKKSLKAVNIFVGFPDWKRDLTLFETYSFPTIICDPDNQQSEFREIINIKRAKLLEWIKYMKEQDLSRFYVNPTLYPMLLIQIQRKAHLLIVKTRRFQWYRGINFFKWVMN